MILQRIYNDALAQASYLVGCSATGEALVIDPNRDIDQYIDAAASEGLRVTAVTETHIHADFVSGAHELAQRTGATLYLSAAGPSDWQYAYAGAAGAVLIRDGAEFGVGNVHIKVWHTPGHTPEHLSFVLTDTAAASEPMGVFSGDFVFVGDVGRPDLLEKAAKLANTTEAGARSLYQSLQQFRAMPDYLQVWPGHGAGSACGKALGAVPQSTVGYERRFNWAFDDLSEDRFVQTVVADQPDPPTYFAQMKRINKNGPAFVADLPLPRHESVAHLAPALATSMLIIDTRQAAEYEAGHIPGTINLPFNTSFLGWAGWIVPYDRPLGLIAEAAQLDTIVKHLRLIGLDAVTMWWTPDVVELWQPKDLASIERIDVERMAELLQHDVLVVDVRNADEYEAGHIAGSRHIPLGQLPHRSTELPADRPVVVHCAAGTRSAIAAGLLSAQGRTQLYDFSGGYDMWRTYVLQQTD